MGAAAVKKSPPIRVDLIEKFEQEFNRELTAEEKRALRWAEQFTAEPYAAPQPKKSKPPFLVDRRSKPRK